jgi:hypothetical protein
MTTPTVTELEILHIKKSVDRIECVLKEVLTLTSHVTLLNERTEVHREETAGMNARLTASITALTVGVKDEQTQREVAVKKVHTRVDTVYKWVYMVVGGGAVVSALLVYAGESTRTLVAEVVSLHDRSLRQDYDIARILQKIDK